MLRAIAFGLAIIASPAGAKEFDWHKLATQKKMHVAFENTAAACAGAFGFTRISPLPSATMVDKLDAYLLLRDYPEAEVESWAIQILGPVNAMLASKGTEATAIDDRRAAAAAVAAAEDPDAYAEAESRYLESATAPFRRALEACSVGANDPFIGRYYWTGSGSSASFEKSMKDWFSDFVAELKVRLSKPPKRQ